MGMTKYDRLLYILNLLRSRRTLNAKNLAEECQVTERSIYRDILSLSEANVPIYYDRGYKLASESFLPTLNFTFEEYSVLRLALESSPLGRTGRKADVLRQVKAKVEASLSASTREQRRTSIETTFIDIDASSPPPQAARFFAMIERACADQTSLDLEYETVEHGATRRRIDPYFIVFRGRAFYVVAYCHVREDFRTFRIERIRRVQPTGEAFRRRHGINARDYFARSWMLFTGEPTDVEILFSGPATRVVTTGRRHPTETVEARADGTVLYKVTVAGTQEISRWILGFGEDAEVLRPTSLRREIARVARTMTKIYGGSRAGRRSTRKTGKKPG